MLLFKRKKIIKEKGIICAKNLIDFDLCAKYLYKQFVNELNEIKNS